MSGSTPQIPETSQSPQSLRALPLATRLALGAALALGLAGLGVSLHLTARAGHGDLGDCLAPEATRLRVCAVPLERAIHTSMARHLRSDRERAVITRWIRAGAPMGGFYEGPGRVIAARCGPCHGAQAGPQGGIRLESYGDALELATPSGRDPYRRLAKLHVHLFAVGAVLVLLAFGLGRTRFRKRLALAVGLAPVAALLLSVPVTLGACQTGLGPPVLWALDGLVVLGWLAGTALVGWDLFAPLRPMT